MKINAIKKEYCVWFENIETKEKVFTHLIEDDGTMHFKYTNLYEIGNLKNFKKLDGPRDCEGELLKVGDRVCYKAEKGYQSILMIDDTFASDKIVKIKSPDRTYVDHPYLLQKYKPKLIKDLPEEEQLEAAIKWCGSQDFVVLCSFKDYKLPVGYLCAINSSAIVDGIKNVYKAIPGKEPELIGPILEQEVL